MLALYHETHTTSETSLGGARNLVEGLAYLVKCVAEIMVHSILRRVWYLFSLEAYVKCSCSLERRCKLSNYDKRLLFFVQNP